MFIRLRSRVATVLPPVLLIALTIFVFGPATVYKGNAVEFGFPLADLLSAYLIPFFGLLLLLTCIGFLLPEKLLRFYVATLFACGLLLWIQGSFLVWNYGLFDGNLINWSKYRWQGYLDLLIWLTFLVLALIFRKKIIRVISFVSWSLIVLQCVLLIVAVSGLKNNSGKTKTNWQVPADLYNYSDSLNVIHFMCDNFQTDVFLEIVKENSLESKLDGFTAFRENLANANSTSISVPSIFSGNTYDGSVSVGDFFNKSISENGFHNILFQKGFKVNFIPHIKMPHNSVTNYYSIPYLYGKSWNDECVFKATYLLDVVFFRLMPHFIKQIFYNGGNWRISPFFTESPNQKIRSVFTFMHDYINNIKGSGAKPVYHYIFIDPPHPPDWIKNDGSFSRKILEPTRENYKIQATHSLYLFIELLNQLSQKGLYDKSLIILQSDHGSSFQPIKNGITQFIGHSRTPAMLAIKRPNEKGIMKISDAQTMNSDIPATIMDILKFENNFNGLSVFSIDTMKNRQREMVIQNERYAVNGSIYNPDSWQIISALEVSKKIPDYSWGTEISFGLNGNAEIYEGAGWNIPEGNGQTTEGKYSRLNLMVDEIKSDILLETKLIPYIPNGKLSRQRVNVLLNGTLIGNWILTKQGQQTCSILIPNNLLTGKSIQLDFILPDADSPKSLGISPDARIRALTMLSMVLKPK